MIDSIDKTIILDPAVLDLRSLLNKHAELNIDHKNYNINVTANYGDKLTNIELTNEFKVFSDKGKKGHLYFHIPLCSYICHFCNYVKKLALPNEQLNKTLDNWVDVLIKEATRHFVNAPWIQDLLIESIYFGGGTAALLKSHHLAKMIDFIRGNYNLSESCEISLEGNPDNFKSEYIKEAVDVGFNRFSVGIQSLQNEVLKFSNRGHTVQCSLYAINKLTESTKPFNADFMFGLPYQTTESVAQDIETLVRLNIPTITIYRLRNVDRASMGIGNRSAWNNTKIQKKYEDLHLFPNTYETYEMRQRIVEIFLKNDYYPSPCGWWSKKNTYTTKGNIPQVSKNKWENLDTMLAYGPGAYGWLTGEDNKIIQTHNIQDIRAYQNFMQSNDELPLAYGRKLKSYEAVAARLGFGFKANQPIKISKFEDMHGINLLSDCKTAESINYCLRNNFLEYNERDHSLKPTLIGEALHEEIISEIIHKRIGGFDESICKK